MTALPKVDIKILIW